MLQAASNSLQTDEDKYSLLLTQTESLISPLEPIISSLSNFTALLKQSFQKVSWVGFYILKDDSLFLGPFQGKVACTEIKIGSGVCGTSAEKKETIIVPDVDKFPGHIACDDGSRSEIVVPVLIKDKLFGVLDLDSYTESAFDEVDKKFLEKLVAILNSKLNLSTFHF
ncbi:MAG: GAF domain-containing protein [Melioribacteraceae bacterium]|nr:GAF domain-containing protein [Melioribacteraceae bacterium]MCF8265303.1 GAF domain-containing protein [Melioribacteraceae bacterium]